MICRELIQFLDDYVEKSVPAGRRQEFDRHLALCASCREYLQSYRETIRMAKAAAHTPDIEDVPPEVLTAILATLARNTSRG